MAAGKIKLQKASGGVTTITGVDGAGSTSLVIPESGTVTTNEYVNSNNLGNGSTTFNGFGGSGFKNYIINGSFNIDQYQSGTQSNWNSANCYIDRFLVGSSSTVTLNGAGANNPIGTGLYKHLSVTKTAGADTQIIQRWEIPKDKAKQFLNGRTLTFSCWVLAETANFVEHLFFIKNGLSANSYEAKSFNITKNNVANVWTRVTGTITNIQWNYEAGDYIEIRLDPVNGVAGELHTTGWQLEEGSVATPFENRPYGLELALCQRYYETGMVDEFYNYTGSVVNIGTGTKYKITKRIIPTVILSYGTLQQNRNDGFSMYGNISAGQWLSNVTFTASAELL